MKKSLLLLLIFNLYLTLNGQSLYYSHYKLTYDADNINENNKIENIDSLGFKIPFAAEINYHILSNNKYMYLIADVENVISILESEKKELEIVKIDIDKKILYNENNNKYYKIEMSDSKSIIVDKNLPFYVTPCIFIDKNNSGIKEFKKNNIKIELIKFHKIKDGIKIDFSKIFKKIDTSKLDIFKYE